MPMAEQGQGKSWKTNHYILAALGGTLAATAVVIIISLILSPAHITFFVAHASTKNLEDGTKNLTLTIAAYNPSRRCQARYQSVFIDLKNTTNTAGKLSIRANVPDKTFPIAYVRGPNRTLIHASVLLVGDYMAYAGRLNGSGLTVVLSALVRFKIGVTPTRMYEIKVFCSSVLFPDEDSNSRSLQSNMIPCIG
ncbi:uncharacterized protein LOC133903627 [Phragmites australis]|uniref:uncharacterized protein LOC133903627 n=1 Tax=Phragmites australis TaxID=29695 RepID=UPI002D7959B6|nr:uncharacterized protein LOC133903627 [Phragmites australis]